MFAIIVWDYGSNQQIYKTSQIDYQSLASENQNQLLNFFSG